MVSHYGSEIKSDNGSPFQSEKFQEFAKLFGFKSRKIPPPLFTQKLTGGSENFVKNIAKLIRNCYVSRLNFKSQLNEFLRSYRDTPHVLTGDPPAKATFSYSPRFSKLPNTIESNIQDELTVVALSNDAKSKEKMKKYANRQNRAQPSFLKVSVKILLDVKRSNILHDKKVTRFVDESYVITATNGSMITASNGRHSITRNSSFSK